MEMGFCEVRSFISTAFQRFSRLERLLRYSSSSTKISGDNDEGSHGSQVLSPRVDGIR